MQFRPYLGKERVQAFVLYTFYRAVFYPALQATNTERHLAEIIQVAVVFQPVEVALYIVHRVDHRPRKIVV